MEYPYLGIKYIGDRHYVVLFAEPETGIIVESNTDDENTKFGKLGTFDEDQFEFYPEQYYVRLTNYNGSMDDIGAYQRVDDTRG